MLMKLTHVVNFINLKRTNFSYEFLLPKQRSYEKFVRKTLMKLTPASFYPFFSLFTFLTWNFVHICVAGRRPNGFRLLGRLNKTILRYT